MTSSKSTKFLTYFDDVTYFLQSQISWRIYHYRWGTVSYLKIISLTLTDKKFFPHLKFFSFSLTFFHFSQKEWKKICKGSRFFSLFSLFFTSPKKVKKILFVREVNPLPPPKKYCYFFVGVGEVKQKNFFGGESEKNFTCTSLFHFRHLKMIFFCRSEK